MEETINGSSDIEEAGQVNIIDPMSDCLVVGAEVGPSAVCVPNYVMSPMKTIETIEVIVSTNKVAVYATIESPKVGMVFKSWQEVESYYKQYAEQQGFVVTRSQGWVSKKNNESKQKG
ncbi:uncharacterized protein LOC110710071 [Chenopodium quinoa]|uniref:uncharacterized protein LOC110710071 n=1 Tax=Chenopodium quinoa TaxID=63459 RepID=UPI000B77B64E|nr:uncharacterized protein LOC110710071 [Chenopodium quinoa]